ncbi:MAG TPA: hypothetical protein VNF93_02280 [Buchnera sp. (in: enterobacteria)]|nr:hypothetical protein [Buchnera sp. (in: enterobacteria)]
MTTSLTFYNFYPVLTPVRLTAEGNIPGIYYNGPLNTGLQATLTVSAGWPNVDNIPLLLNDYVLLANQTNENENGIYQVTTIGAPTVFTRRADFQSIEQIQTGQIVTVGAGSTLAGSSWVVCEPLPAALGIDDLVFNPVSVPSGSTFLVASNNLSDVSNAATARTNLGAQSSANIKSATTGNIGGAGAGPITVPVTGMTASSIVVATIATSSNPASVIKAVAGSGSFDVTFSADPGATCTLNYVAFIAPQ